MVVDEVFHIGVHTIVGGTLLTDIVQDEYIAITTPEGEMNFQKVLYLKSYGSYFPCLIKGAKGGVMFDRNCNIKKGYYLLREKDHGRAKT